MRNAHHHPRRGPAPSGLWSEFLKELLKTVIVGVLMILLVANLKRIEAGVHWLTSWSCQALRAGHGEQIELPRACDAALEHVASACRSLERGDYASARLHFVAARALAHPEDQAAIDSILSSHPELARLR